MWVRVVSPILVEKYDTELTIVKILVKNLAKIKIVPYEIKSG
jgi:hypothetical protein